MADDIKRLYFKDTVPGPKEAGKTLELDVDGKLVTADVVSLGFLLTGPRRTVLVPWGTVKAVEYRRDAKTERGDTPSPTPTTGGTSDGRRLPKT